MADLNKIKQSQIEAGEKAVIDGLREKGLLPEEPQEPISPFELEDIEDARIIIKAKGKHYSIASSGNKEEAKAYRVALVQALLSMEDTVIVTPALEDLQVPETGGVPFNLVPDKQCGVCSSLNQLIEQWVDNTLVITCKRCGHSKEMAVLTISSTGVDVQINSPAPPRAIIF